MKSALKPKRTDFSFHSGVFDYAAIRRAAAPNPFGIEPDAPRKPLWVCTQSGCSQIHDPNTNETRGKCAGWCSLY